MPVSDSTPASRVYARLEPIAYGDEDAGYPLYGLVEALTLPQDALEEIVREDGGKLATTRAIGLHEPIILRTLSDDYDIAILYGTSANARMIKSTDAQRTRIRIVNSLTFPIMVGTGAVDTTTSPSGFVEVPAGAELSATDHVPYWAYAPLFGGHVAGADAGFVRVYVEQSA